MDVSALASFCRVSGSRHFPRQAEHSGGELSPALVLGDAGLKWCQLEGRTDGMRGTGSFESKTGLVMAVGAPHTICSGADLRRTFGKGGEMLSSKMGKYVETLLLNISKKCMKDVYVKNVDLLDCSDTAIYKYSLHARLLCSKHQLYLLTFGENKHTKKSYMASANNLGLLLY